MDFYGTKLNGQKSFPPAIAEQRRRAWNKVKEGQGFKESLTVPRPGKTQKQLGAIWGLMMAQAVSKLYDKSMDTSYLYGLDKPTGVPISKDHLCLYLYAVCPIFDKGQVITLSNADIDQASEFFEDSRNWLSSQFGIFIDDPNPNRRNETIGDNLE